YCPKDRSLWWRRTIPGRPPPQLRLTRGPSAECAGITRARNRSRLPGQRAVAADNEQGVNAQFTKPVHHFPGVLRAPGRAQDAPPKRVDFFSLVGRQLGDRVPVRFDEAFVAAADTVDFTDAIAIIRLQHKPPDHIIESRAQPAAGDDRATRFRRVK